MTSGHVMSAVSDPSSISVTSDRSTSASSRLTGQRSESGRLAWRHDADGVHITHGYTSADVCDSLLVEEVGRLVEVGAIAGQVAFEAVMTAILDTCAENGAGWDAFYDNSLAELRSGRSPFSPVHHRALQCLSGTSILEVGSCFGFLALQAAEDASTVHACDISAGSVELLRRQSRRCGTPIDCRWADARDLPYPDGSIDTVTLIHLLEHLDGSDVRLAVEEATRVARTSVVIAVPFEEVPNEHYGHRQSLTLSDLAEWGTFADTRQWSAEISEHHGGWLQLSRR
ncbi:mycofactocin oligosaccharide methyltransferase MftM [Gordonia jinhuaensis]|nr:mycofactocin oligosaccharide methyltransferase MftM [Gordonia jinhuaensis]